MKTAIPILMYALLVPALSEDLPERWAATHKTAFPQPQFRIRSFPVPKADPHGQVMIFLQEVGSGDTLVFSGRARLEV